MSRMPALLLAAFTALAPTVGHAADTALASDDVGQVHSQDHISGVRADVHGNFGGYGSVGAGFRVDIPIVPHGVLNNVDDELALSPGADVFFAHAYQDYYAGGPYLIPSVVLQWNFYVGRDWSVFPEAGLAVYVGEADYLRRGQGVYVAPDFGVGARYHFSPRNALLMRVSTPAGFQLGMTF